MLLTYGLLLFLYVFAQLVSGAPLPSKRNLVSIRNDLDPLANSKTISDNLEFASLHKYPDPDSASVVLSTDKFLSMNRGSDYFARKPAMEFYPADFERSDVDEISAMDDNESMLPEGETDLVIRSRNDLAIHARTVESLQTAGKGMQSAGEIMGKVAKAADAIPEVGEIIGTAIQVVATFVKYIGKLLNEVAEAEKESAHTIPFHSTGGPPKNSKPKSGNCGIHLYQYQKNEKRSNPTNHYTLVVVIKDAAGTIVGFEGNGDTSKPVLVRSQLPLALQITAGEKDSSPLTFTYGKDTWKSNVKSHCTVGSYASGSRQMDCGFQCTF
ncbi:hypothetical protein HHX47_DHR9000542 [Lentinula edodes]|nr:hypothetical protein HHX47_DHR9000542 [Lentinula edodes]